MRPTWRSVGGQGVRLRVEPREGRVDSTDDLGVAPRSAELHLAGEGRRHLGEADGGECMC